MAKLEVVRTKNEGSGEHLTIKSTGLDAHADFDPITGVAEVEFQEAENMASALQAVVDTLRSEAHLWETNPILLLRIDIDPGKFAKSLQQVAPRFGFSHQQRAGEFGMVEQHPRFRAELPLGI